MHSLLSKQSKSALSRARGLSMVEILVVVGVIALLMGLLLPALGSVRRSARAVACASNMKQIGLAHQMYARDNRGDVVSSGLSHGGSPGDPRISWLTKLPRYMDGLSALRSPVDQSPFWSVEDGGEHNGMTLKQAIAHLQADPNADIPNDQVSRWSSYGLNVMVSGHFNGYTIPNGPTLKWTNVNDVPRPSTTVHFLMLTDGMGMGDPAFARSDHADTDNFVQLPSSWVSKAPSKAAREVQTNAHGGRLGSWSAMSNYLFMDGSVQTLQFNVVYENNERNRFLPIASPSN